MKLNFLNNENFKIPTSFSDILNDYKRKGENSALRLKTFIYEEIKVDKKDDKSLLMKYRSSKIAKVGKVR